MAFARVFLTRDSKRWKAPVKKDKPLAAAAPAPAAPEPEAEEEGGIADPGDSSDSEQEINQEEKNNIVEFECRKVQNFSSRNAKCLDYFKDSLATKKCMENFCGFCCTV